MNIRERAVQTVHKIGNPIQGIDHRIEHSKIRKVLEPFAPGDASLGEMAVRAGVDGIPVGISLTMIRAVAAGNYEVLIIAPFFMPVALMLSIGTHYYLGETRKNSKEEQK